MVATNGFRFALDPVLLIYLLIPHVIDPLMLLTRGTWQPLSTGQVHTSLMLNGPAIPCALRVHILR
jgi:hypothetical protein